MWFWFLFEVDKCLHDSPSVYNCARRGQDNFASAAITPSIWPRLAPLALYDLAALAQPLSDVSRAQGLLLGRMVDMRLATRTQASPAALTDDVINTSEIEGEHLDAQSRYAPPSHVAWASTSAPSPLKVGLPVTHDQTLNK